MELKDSLYSRNPDYISRRIVEEMILVPIHQDIADMNCIYTLNDVGAFLWEQLATPNSVDALQTALLKEYEVDNEVAAADVASFLDEMAKIGALRKVVH